MTGLPPIRSLDDFRQILDDLPGPDDDAAAAAAAREPQLTKPPGSLGRLEELSAWLASWQGRQVPRMENPAARIFAGNHGVAASGVSAFPAEVTIQMVANFQAGGAAVNQLCKTFGVDLGVRELSLARPTGNFLDQAAMSDVECAEAITIGMESVSRDMDVLCLGEMGIANTTPSAAICYALFGGDAAEWTGPGTGVQGKALAHKTAVVAQGVKRHADAMRDALEVLRCVGGRELAAIVGAVVAARLLRVPVMLDGYVCTSAAAVLEVFTPGALDHCQVGHVSAEPGHVLLLAHIDKEPLFDLGMRLGEGSGAVLAVGLLQAAVNCHTGMATFGEAGVSEK